MTVTSFLVGTIIAGVGVYYLYPEESGANALTDSDGDGRPDLVDTHPNDQTQWSDIDGDGYDDNATGSNRRTLQKP